MAGTIASLIVNISANTADLERPIKAAGTTLGSFEVQVSKTTGMLSKGFLSASTALGTFAGNAAWRLVETALGAISSQFFSVIDASNRFRSAFMGLDTVASAFGVGLDAARQAAKDLAADGLMKVSDAAAGLKNLLSAGFGLDQAIQLMKGFKDSAAFNRQASLEFGQAIVGATEGIKNQNSTLIDNAGLTKNYSNIVKDAGLKVEDMGRISTDAGVRTKVFGGLLKELSIFTGDAAKVSQTYTGALSALSTQFELGKAQIGDYITNNQTIVTVIREVTDWLEHQRVSLAGNQTAMNFVSDATGFLLKTFGLLAKSLAVLVDLAYTTAVAFQSLAYGSALAAQGINGVILAAVKAADAQGIPFLGEVIKGLQKDYDEAGARAHIFGQAIDETATSATNKVEALLGVQAGLSDLVSRLEQTRGKEIELADGLDRGTRALNDQGDAASRLERQYHRLVNAMRGVVVGQADALGRFMPQTANEMQARFKGVLAPGGGGTGVTGLGELMNKAAQSGAGVMSIFNGPLTRGMKSQGVSNEQGGLASMLGAQLGPTIMSALTGGGSITKSLGGLFGGGITEKLFGAGSGLGKAVTGGLSKMLGSTIGGALGSMLPGIGALAGPAIEGLGKLFGKMFGGEGKKVNDMRDQFIGAAGGLEALNQKAVAAGTNLDALLRAKKVKDFEAAVESLNGKMGAFANQQEADAARVQAAFQKWGFTFDEIGAKQQQIALNDQARELSEDWRVLKAAGVDVSITNTKMADTVNEYFQTALSAGLEIPSAMRPILESMAAQGLLLDANGTKILDLAESGALFAASMGDVVNKLDQVIDRLGQVADGIGNAFGVPNGMGIPDLGGIPQMASGGIVRRPTLALIGERGPEAVVPLTGGGSDELRGLRADLARFMRTMPMAMRDAVLLAQ